MLPRLLVFRLSFAAAPMTNTDFLPLLCSFMFCALEEIQLSETAPRNSSNEISLRVGLWPKCCPDPSSKEIGD